MQYDIFEVAIQAWEGRSYEIIARCSRPAGPASARQVARFPLGPSALQAQLPAVRRALSRVDLKARRGAGADERAIEEFAVLLYRFIFSGEARRLFDEARAAAVADWKGLRLVLRIFTPDLQDLPWEVLWDILAFDLRSLKRGVFDLRVERSAVVPAFGLQETPAEAFLPSLFTGSPPENAAPLAPAEAAFYRADFETAIELLDGVLRLFPELAQAGEFRERARECLERRDPTTIVPPRAASDYRRAWEAFTRYRFNEAARFLDEAWLLAKDWGIAEWPEARAFHERLERCQTGFASYLKAQALRRSGNLADGQEALAQAHRADPLVIYQ
jgi:hypothetical protein